MRLLPRYEVPGWKHSFDAADGETDVSLVRDAERDARMPRGAGFDRHRLSDVEHSCLELRSKRRETVTFESALKRFE